MNIIIKNKNLFFYYNTSGSSDSFGFGVFINRGTSTVSTNTRAGRFTISLALGSTGMAIRLALFDLAARDASGLGGAMLCDRSGYFTQGEGR